MSAGIHNFKIEQGTDWSATLTLTDENNNPIDLTNHTARMQIRERYNSSTIIKELTTENGKITITPALGQIVLSLTNSETSELSTNGVYDLELINNNDNTVKRLLQGQVKISLEVTK